uniref:CRAL-TRIO domain-containing protein n=1 Tax=Musca domestica TaxID=7370 RepID=A0A1I8MQN8_MUSDO
MLNIKPLSKPLQKIAQLELGEIPERIPTDLENFKEWIGQQPHLRTCQDDQFLIQFLRGCKYSQERAKEKLDRYYSLMTKYPEIFSVTDVDDAIFRKHHNVGSLLPLPLPLNDSGPRIMMFRFNYSPKTVNIETVFRSINAIPQVLMMDDPHACICGTIYLVDMSQVTAGHLLQLTPPFIKKIVTYYENTLPLRVKAIYCLNITKLTEQLLKLILSFMSEKLRRRVFICGKDFQSLYATMPQKYFPQEYGGLNGQLDKISSEFNKKWDAYREYFQNNAKYGTIESLRPGNPIDFDDMFGLGGSFRKLDVD